MLCVFVILPVAILVRILPSYCVCVHCHFLLFCKVTLLSACHPNLVQVLGGELEIVNYAVETSSSTRVYTSVLYTDVNYAVETSSSTRVYTSHCLNSILKLITENNPMHHKCICSRLHYSYRTSPKGCRRRFFFFWQGVR